jgi:hypothetical protein
MKTAGEYDRKKHRHLKGSTSNRMSDYVVGQVDLAILMKF